MRRKTAINRYLGGVFVFAALVGMAYLIVNFLTPQCANSLSCKESLELKVENDVLGVWSGQKVIPPKVDLAKKDFKATVLGEVAGEKHVYVDLSTQTLTAYQGETLFMKTLISSGKWGRTPTGEYTVWVKLRATRMSGGSGNDYYNLPNVPYVMFFSGPNAAAGRGFSLHGTYWHNNFGHPMSHGCVNMRIVDAQKLYDWVDPPTTSNTTYADENNPGTKITIYGQTPG